MRDVLGRGRIVDDEIGGPVGARPVHAEERLEVGRRPGLRPADERRLASLARHPERRSARQATREPEQQSVTSGRAHRADTSGEPPKVH